MSNTACPEALTSAAEVLSSYPSDWSLCGGWAVDAWLRRQTREHPDVDISVRHEAQRDLLGFFGTGWLLNGHDETDEEDETQWDGRPLGHPGHVHARHADGMHLDFQLDLRTDDEWVLVPEPRLALPLDDCVASSSWGVPAVTPQVLLFYKGSGEIRPHDQADFELLAPLLDEPVRRWLHAALGLLNSRHPWLDSLRRPASGR